MKRLLIVLLSFFVFSSAFAQMQVGVGVCLNKKINFAHIAYVRPVKSLKLVFRPNVGLGYNWERRISLVRAGIIVAKPVNKSILTGVGIVKLLIFTPLGVKQKNNFVFSVNLNYKRFLFMFPIVYDLKTKKKNFFFEIAFSL